MNKTKSTMNIDTIGNKEKNKGDHKVSYFLFGDLTMKKRRNMLHLFVGILNIKIFLLFH